ncbi:anthranilate synthase component I family protein [Candidatus Peregrinibacteria bacterium]|jgi:para-aminobenzoate synthetase component I|nr:anthranilate synthase component I family protein [Candidatus Peregrinibacteria bacterium]
MESSLLHQSGSFWLRAKDRIFVGFGIADEWKAETWEEAQKALQDMRGAPGFKAGYLSYDFGVAWQGVVGKKNDPLKTPLLHFVVPEQLYVFDIDNPAPHQLLQRQFFQAGDPQADLSQAEYEKNIAKIHELLRAGETYEVNFAQRFSGEFDGDPLEVFRRLNEANPSPHACYFNFDPITVVSCSPERLVLGRRVLNPKKEERMLLETRPIKGTVPRGTTPGEDAKYIEQLLASKKDEAELNMIVDLARNDLGRVCETGSVEVTEHRAVESYSHVHHTMSNVRGVLRKDLDWVDAMEALFPGGSITGAPKYRTMQIIDNLEPCLRGIYTGSAGYIDEDGQFDFNILIRTIAFNRETQKYSYHSGGAIVTDSVAKEEYQETLQKAAALKNAL